MCFAVKQLLNTSNRLHCLTEATCNLIYHLYIIVNVVKGSIRSSCHGYCCVVNNIPLHNAKYHSF